VAGGQERQGPDRLRAQGQGRRVPIGHGAVGGRGRGRERGRRAEERGSEQVAGGEGPAGEGRP